MKVGEWVSSRVFGFVHGKNLVYNTCWEDPRLDHVALKLTPQDDVMVITSAGCNALDYAIKGPRHVWAVDMNPRQNALLELKLSAIRNLDYDQYFSMFGLGRLPHAHHVYREKLREDLSRRSRMYWDRWIKFFGNRRRPFYFRGTSGMFARWINVYVDRIAKLRPAINEMLETKTIEEQREIWDSKVRPRLWTKPLKFAMKRDSTMALLGVPRAQREHLENHYEGGILKFVQDSLEAVFRDLPIQDNYFWRVYLTGHYTPECCPEYLKEENYHKLRGGLADRVSTHTDSVQGFLEKHDGTISRFVLLDHMDWMSVPHRLFMLEGEWKAILERARPGATRVLWRSGGLRSDFVDEVRTTHQGKPVRVGDLLTYHREQSEELHKLDRVHTYGSFQITDLGV